MTSRKGLFKKAICIVLAAVVCSDSLPAASIHDAFLFPVSSLSDAQNAFQFAALTELLAASTWAGSQLKTSRTLGVLTLAASLLPGSAAGSAQKSQDKQPEKSKQPPVERLKLPQAPQIDQQNKLLTDPVIREAIRQTVGSSSPDGQFESQLEMAEGSPAVFQHYLEEREALQAEIAEIANQGKYTSFVSDQLHGLGVAIVGPYSTIDQALAYPNVNATNPKSQVQIAESGTGNFPEDKGFLYWRVLTHVLESVVNRLFTGVQFYSKNQIEMAFLREHEKDFETRRAFTRLQQTLQDRYVQTVRTWSAYVKQTGDLAALRDTAWIQQRRYDLEKRAGALENRDPDILLNLRTSADLAGNAYESAHNALEQHRLKWLEAWADSEETLNKWSAQPLQPVPPVWAVTPDLLERSGQVRTLLDLEHSQLRAQEALPLASRDVETSLNDSVKVPAPQADFLAVPGTESKGYTVPEADLDALFAPIQADVALGRSALQDELVLQQQLLRLVQIPLLKLQKQKTWKAGIHFDLGTLPFLATLLNFDLKSPSASTQFSLDSLIIAVELKIGSLDSQIRAVQIRERSDFQLARAERQRALAELVALRNLYVQYTTQELSAVRSDRSLPADRNTPALQRERIKKQYATQLTQAWLAWKIMDLYSVNGQALIRARAGSLNARIVNRLNAMTAAAKPSASNGRLIRWVLPAMTLLFSVMIPGLAQAQSLSSQASSAYPEGLLSLSGILTGAVLVGAVLGLARYFKSRQKTERASVEFTQIPVWVVLPLLGLALAFHLGLPVPFSVLMSFPVFGIYAGWMKAGAILLGSGALISKRMDASGTPIIRLGLPLLVAAWIGWVLGPVSWGVWGLVVGLSWLMMQVQLISETDAAYDVLGRVGRDRRTLLAALVLSVPFLTTLKDKVIDPVNDKSTEVIENISNLNILATNFGVGLSRPVQIPVTWAPPAHEDGVVSRVQYQKLEVVQGQLVIAYESLPTSLIERLRDVRSDLQKIHKEDVISSQALEQAAHTPNNALITVRGELTSESVDGRILKALTNFETMMAQYHLADARAGQNARLSGEKILPFDQEEVSYRLLELGRRLEALLHERQERNIPARHTFDIFPGAGIIEVGSSLRAGAPGPLFTQELPDYREMTLLLTPTDAMALQQQWHLSPDNTSLKIRTPNRESIELPLSQIQDLLRPEDISFRGQVGVDDFMSSRQTNSAIGLDPVIPLAMIVPSSWLGQAIPGNLEFQGIWQNGERLVPDAEERTIGSASIYSKTPTIPRHTFRLQPLRAQRAAVDELLGHLSALRQKIQSHKKTYEDDGRDWADLRIIQLEDDSRAWEGERAKLDDEIRKIEQTGIPVTKDVQAVNWFRDKHYPLRRDIPAPREEEAVMALGEQVTVRVAFFASAATLERGDIVSVYVGSRGEPMRFKIEENKTPTGREDLNLLFAEYTMPLEQARTLFPEGRPMTRTLVQVQLRPISTFWQWLRPRMHIPRASPGSQLQWVELAKGMAWAAFLLPVLAAVQVAEIAPEFTGVTAAGSIGLGFLSAIAAHEFLGHGLTAIFGGHTGARLRITSRGLEWMERVKESWQPLESSSVRRAGPIASEWLVRSALAGIFLQALSGIHLLNPFALIAVSLASLAFRQADALPVGQEAVAEPAFVQVPEEPETAAADLSKPKQPKTRDTHSSYLTTKQIEDYSLSLKNGPLEEERYWYAGDPTTFLTYFQRLTRGFRSEIQYTHHSMLYSKYRREGVTKFHAWLMGVRYSLDEKEATAGQKTRTFVIVWFIIGALILTPFFVPAQVLQPIVQGISNSSILGGIVNNLVSHPDYGLLPLLIVIFFAGWVIGGGSEFWGKFFATGWWILRYIPLMPVYALYGPGRKFLKKTAKEPKKAWEEIRNDDILYRSYDEDSPHRQFLDNFASVAREISDRAHANLVNWGPGKEEAMAFEVDFRIQLRRSRNSRSPIYPRDVPRLTSDETHLRRLRAAHPDFDQKSNSEQFRLLQEARAEEATRLARRYPEHTLMALLRSGTTELIAQINQIPDAERREAIKAVLIALRARVHSIDPDAVGGVLAKQRFDDVFELLHYVFDVLKRSVEENDPDLRQQTMKPLERIVDNAEFSTWVQLEKDLVPLMTAEGKSKEQKESDQGNIKMILYALTTRITKETSEFKRWLFDLQKAEPHTPDQMMKDRYLRGYDAAKMHFLPTTSVLQLTTAYDEHYDMVRQFLDTFPGVRILGNRDIYLTCENIVNFRQAAREISFWLRLTGGRVIILDVGGTHPKFFRFLRTNIRKRLLWRDMDRVVFRTVPTLDEADPLARDRSAVVVLSSTPGDYMTLKRVSGTMVIVPSELFSTAVIPAVVEALSGPQLEALFHERLFPLLNELNALRTHRQSLEVEFQSLNIELDKGFRGFVENQPEGSRFQRFYQKWIGEGLGLQAMDNRFTRIRQDLDRIDERQADLQQQIDDLNRMKRGFKNVFAFMNSIGVETGEFAADEQNLPVVKMEDVTPGTYKLVFVIRRALSQIVKPPAPESDSGLGEHKWWHRFIPQRPHVDRKLLTQA